MLTGVEGGVKMGGVELQLGYFRALRARVVSTAVWFVVVMLEVEVVGAAAGPTVEVATDGSLLGVLVAGGARCGMQDEKGRKGWTGFDRLGQPKVR